VRFWDSSAVVPLLIQQDSSSRAATWAGEDDAKVIWTLTPVEVVSALRRLVRDGALSEDVARVAGTRLAEMMERCHAFGALQLGAALQWAEGHPQDRTLHTLDIRLGRAAEREGFVVRA
jgi:uncharacterized protein